MLSIHTILTGIQLTLPANEIPDIEDICTLCEPLPKAVPVTIYPMKTKRKAIREELDLVNVVEWRRHDDNERWFLLVRRPGKGWCTFPNRPFSIHSFIGMLCGLL